VISAIFAFGIALLVVIAATPLVRRFAIEVGAVDRPSERRVHGRVVPRLGGIALVLAFFAPLLALFLLETDVARRFFSDPLRIVGLAVGGVIVMGLGVLDDVRGVRAWTKLWVQTSAALVAFACGFRIEAVAIPLLGHLEMGVFAAPVTVLWIVAIVNAINLIDGLDGLAGGIAFFACITNFVVGAINADPLVMLLSASLGGAVLGFLLYNWNPASVFMGDSGSLFLGYVLATTSILGSAVKSSTTVAILVPLVALGLPIMDTLFAMLRRFLERRPIFSPDRGHIHHQLLAMGINHRRAVLTLYGLSILFTAGAILISIGRNWQVGGALLLLSIAVIGVVRSMGNLHGAVGRWRRHERVRPACVDRLRRSVPPALAGIAAARRPDDIPELLAELGSAASLDLIELADSDAQQLPSFAWSAAEVSEAVAPSDATMAVYPLAAAGGKASLRFAWTTEQPELPPEAEILLQLVVDAVEDCLGRTRVARPAPATAVLRSL
jgi:UDP-GlcNAc:undecaprenyl-phosphate GlcNAc-1-phosphate transferase